MTQVKLHDLKHIKCNFSEPILTFFARTNLFPCGATPSRTVNKSQPVEVAFSV